MYESSNKKTGEKPIKIFLKPSSKLNNYKDEEKPTKENDNQEKEIEKEKNNINTNKSSEINNNNKIIHKNKLEEIEMLKKQLENLENENNILEKEKSTLKEQQRNYKEKYNRINDELDTEKDELEELRNINDEKNRKYLELNHLRHQQQISNNNDNNNNNNNNTDSNNNENEGINDILNGFNFLLNISRLRRASEEEGDDSQIFFIPHNNEEDRDEGPSMTHEQLEALPSMSYPRNNRTNEKCTICEFEFCYKDTVTKLNCNHSFHKNCLINRLTARNSSKCPICKTSII